MAALIEIENLTFSYKPNFKLLNNINLNLNEKEIICIKGNNGVGKTTLLKIICNLIGTNNYNLKYKGNSTSFKYMKDKIAYIPSRPYLYGKLTGKENLQLICNLWKEDSESFKEKSINLLNIFNLKDHLDTYVENYSLGMKHKLYLIGMLSRKSEIIVMDEPLTALDLKSQNTAISYFHNYISLNKGIIFVSHMQSLINELSTKNLTLNNGKLLFE